MKLIAHLLPKPLTAARFQQCDCKATALLFLPSVGRKRHGAIPIIQTQKPAGAFVDRAAIRRRQLRQEPPLSQRSGPPPAADASDRLSVDLVGQFHQHGVRSIGRINSHERRALAGHVLKGWIAGEEAILQPDARLVRHGHCDAGQHLIAEECPAVFERAW